MRLRELFIGASLVASGSLLYGAQKQDADWMGTAVVVSVDPSTRLAVIKDSTGNQETVELDDNVAGFEGIRAGDRVMMTLRNEPGRRRVSSIVKSTTPAPTKSTAGLPARPPGQTKPVSTAPRRVEVVPNGDPEVARVAIESYSNQVAALAEQASAIDRLWGAFRSACNVTVASAYSGGREWFSLWDNQVQADLSSGHCRDLRNQIIDRGESLKAGMQGAEESARKAFVLPGDLRDVRTRYGLDWEGWDRPAPDRSAQ